MRVVTATRSRTTSTPYAIGYPREPTSSPAISGPTVMLVLFASVDSAFAAGSRWMGSRRGTIEERAGLLTANRALCAPARA